MGVLMLAHGGNEYWNEQVLKLVATLENRYLIDVAFGMADKRNIQDAIDRLVKRGVKEIVAVPLFVSSYGSVQDATEYLLGVRLTPPSDYALLLQHHHSRGAKPAASAALALSHPHHTELPPPLILPVPVSLTSALDDDPLIADILLDRAQAISRQPKEEAIIIVGHGPNSDEDNDKWLTSMRHLADFMQRKSAFSDIEVITVRDDAPAPIRDRATAELRELVTRKTSEGKKALVVPLRICFGGIERGIEKRLDGLDYVLSRQGLLPDARMAQWVVSQVERVSPIKGR
jgi:hypothetical protein